MDASSVGHDFLSTPDGTITATFDVPGGGTFAYCNNPRNAITGFYVASQDHADAFIAPEKGEFIIFDTVSARTWKYDPAYNLGASQFPASWREISPPFASK